MFNAFVVSLLKAIADVIGLAPLPAQLVNLSF